MSTFLQEGNAGIRTILSVLDRLKNKNLTFFQNTFNFFLKQHPPFEESYIYFDTPNNDFKFLSKSKLKGYKVHKMLDYKYDTGYNLIKDVTFHYGVIVPHRVIVASADWLNDDLKKITNKNIEEQRDILADKFHTWYIKTVDKEISFYNNILNTKEEHAKQLL